MLSMWYLDVLDPSHNAHHARCVSRHAVNMFFAEIANGRSTSGSLRSDLISPLLGIPCHSKGLLVTSLSLPENHCKQKLRGSRIIWYIYDIIRSSYIINSESSQIFGMFYFLRSPSSVRVFRSSKPTRWTSSRPKFSRNNSDASPQGAPRNRVQKLWRLRWPHMN